jgi:arsenate reductase
MPNDAAVTIYHNPNCSTSRKVLALIRERGFEPLIIEYLKTPPDRATLQRLVASNGAGVRGVLRAKEPLVRELGLDGSAIDDDTLLAAMLAHPVLIDRPIVVTARATRLCRPAETVLGLLEGVA